MKVTNQFNYEVTQGKKVTQVSQTVPDQTMPIRTILERYAKGLPVNGYKTPIYEDTDFDNYLPDPRTMDLAERQQLQKQAKEQYKQITEKYNKTTNRDSQHTEGANDRPTQRSGVGGEAPGVKLA